MSITTNIQKCITACKKSMQKNEYNIRKIKGISCSHSDVETILLYAQTIQQYGTYEGKLMRPHGAIADVLKGFELLPA